MKKITLIFSLFLIFSCGSDDSDLVVSYQERVTTILNQSPETNPLEDSSLFFSDLSYGTAERNTYDILLPKDGAPIGVVIFFHGGSFLFNDKRFKRVVMDYIDEKMIKFYQSSEEFFKSKKDQRVILLTTKSSESYAKFKFENNDTLLFGRESAGVPNHVHNSIKYKLKIPMKDNKRSLNIASSVAIILSENLRQTIFIK